MPLPNVVGQVIRRIDMHHSSPGKDKEYRISISQDINGQCRVYTAHGPTGRLQNGKEQSRWPVSLGLAMRIAESVRDGKIKQADSYRVMSDQRFPSPQNAPSSHSAAPASAPLHRRRVGTDSLSPSSLARLSLLF